MITSKLRSIVHVLVGPPERKIQELSAEYRKFLIIIYIYEKSIRQRKNSERVYKTCGTGNLPSGGWYGMMKSKETLSLKEYVHE